MKNDARFLLNKKKWSNSSVNHATGIHRNAQSLTRTPVDARKILNLKRANKIVPKKQIIRGTLKTNQSAKPIFTKAFSSVSKVPEKHIKVTNDGNILITAKSKNNQKVAQSSQRISSIGTNAPSSSKQIQNSVHHWVPADVEMDNLEHVGIDDLIDMESLPPAVVSPNVMSRNRLLSRTFADDGFRMQNTMVADQIASTSASQALRVLVTNLCSSVSKQDIMELFGDVGIVKSSEMPQPGTAIVEFFDTEDASKACSTYHNRLLDGQPMKCYLQTNVSPQKLSVSQRLGGRIQTAPSIASSSSFTSNPRSRYNPRDVRFTVKLT